VIRPWCHRSWIFPRDPAFEEKAGRILDLYEGVWEGRPLTARDFVISTDEKTSIQARRRIHATRPPGPGEPMRIEHEYQRKGAWAYLAAWDVRRAKIFGRCEPKDGHRPLWTVGRAGDEAETLPFGPTRLLDHGQRLVPPRRKG